MTLLKLGNDVAKVSGNKKFVISELGLSVPGIMILYYKSAARYFGFEVEKITTDKNHTLISFIINISTLRLVFQFGIRNHSGLRLLKYGWLKYPNQEAI